MIRRRHAIPATLTSTGRVTQHAPLLAGPADALTGLARYREVYRRARKAHGRRTAAAITWLAFRHGVVLSGSPCRVPPGPPPVKEAERGKAQ